MELGQIYRSKGIISNSESLPNAMRPDQWNGQPGTRAPHLWIKMKGRTISTLDLFQNGWVLITANKGWKNAAQSLNSKIELESFLLNNEFTVDDVKDFTTLYSIGENGATLIRPDGFVAWKTEELTVNLNETLSQAVKQTSFPN